jgi:multisubunit Na+/H+ antiporter MnhB subunit
MTFSKSQGGFVALVIISFVIILVVAIAKLPGNYMNLPGDVLNALWYLLVAMIFVIAIAWLVYRKSRDSRKQNSASRSAGAGSTGGRDEPRIGYTYRSDDEDG